LSLSFDRVHALKLSFYLDHCACCARALKQDVSASSVVSVSGSSTREAQHVHRVSDLEHDDGLQAQFALLEVNRVKSYERVQALQLRVILTVLSCYARTLR
jgi:hypothetical protein